MHASPGNLWRAPMDTADDAELENTYKQLNAADRRLLPHSPAIHSQIGSMTVCNTGSVGSPYDGDPRASYLMIDNGKPATRRVAYDVEKEVGRLLASDYPQKEWIAEMRRKGSYVPPPENGVKRLAYSLSIKPFNLLDVMRWESAPAPCGKPRRFPPSAWCILCRCGYRTRSDIRFPCVVGKSTMRIRTPGNGTRGQVVAIPMAVADVPLPAT